jgi:hypothetical protein
VRIIAAAAANSGCASGLRVVTDRVVLASGCLALSVFLAVLRALFTALLAVLLVALRAVLADRRAPLVECVLMGLVIAAYFTRVRSFFQSNYLFFSCLDAWLYHTTAAFGNLSRLKIPAIFPWKRPKRAAYGTLATDLLVLAYT